MALDTNSEAYLPVILSLVKLHIRSAWHTMMGGKNGLTLWDERACLLSPPFCFSDVINIFIHTYLNKNTAPSKKDPRTIDSPKDPETTSEELPEDEYAGEADDSDWYIGKAREDHKKRMRAAEEQRLQEEEDTIQVRKQLNCSGAGRSIN